MQINTNKFNTERFNSFPVTPYRAPHTPMRPSGPTNGINTTFKSQQYVPNRTVMQYGNTQRQYKQLKLTGSFSAVRAALILHLYAIDFWDSFGVIDMVCNTTQPDPTAAQVSTLYSDFLLFNYLPPDMTPSLDEFTAAVTPSLVSATIKNALPSIGISPPVSVPTVNSDGAPFIPAQQPFAITLNGSPFANQPILNRNAQ
jgi:hypothetical protein